MAYRGEDQIKKGLLLPGIELYKKAVKIWPENVRAKKGLAEAYIMAENFSKSIQTFGEIIQKNALDWQGWAGLANAQARSNQLDVALEAYTRSLEINTYNAVAHLGIGNLLFKMNKNVQADRHLKKAIELDSSIAEAYIYLAGIRMRQQKYKSAAIILDQALVLNPIHKIGNMMKSELNQIK